MRSCAITVSANFRASADLAGSSIGMKISDTRNSGLPTWSLKMRSCSATSAPLMSALAPSSSRSTRVQPSCTRTWSISVRIATPWPRRLAPSAPFGMPLRCSISPMASAISRSLTPIRRRCTSCSRNRSSTSCLATCGRSRVSTSGVTGSPVLSANSRPRLLTSPLVTTSPFTTATICPALPSSGAATPGCATAGITCRRGCAPALPVASNTATAIASFRSNINILTGIRCGSRQTGRPS